MQWEILKKISTSQLKRDSKAPRGNINLNGKISSWQFGLSGFA